MCKSDYRFVYKHFRASLHGISFEEACLGAAVFRPRAGGKLCHYQRGESKWVPVSNGGVTICYVYEGDCVVATGEAECSIKDQFNYRIGRDIARGRALKSLGV